MWIWRTCNHCKKEIKPRANNGKGGAYYVDLQVFDSKEDSYPTTQLRLCIRCKNKFLELYQKLVDEFEGE